MMKVSTVGLYVFFNLVSFIFGLEQAVIHKLVEEFGKISDERSHKIIRRELPPNITSEGTSGPTTHLTSIPTASTLPTRIHVFNVTEDNHRYYKSKYYRFGEQWWYNMDEGGNATLHVGLSNNFQYSDKIQTSFMFPYYGHLVKNITITNKGYLFLGDVLHKFNASMQYVAPLQADFTTHVGTRIRYVDTGDRFTVEWSGLKFQNHTKGQFSFQCSILKNGTLIFAYKNIPFPVAELKSKSLKHRVGLSDSYRRRFYVPRRVAIFRRIFRVRLTYIVYFKYHEVKLPFENVKSGSAFVITPLPNCVIFNSCDTCVNSNTSFSCAWCPALKRCSDGIDRHREEWLVARCPASKRESCPFSEKPEDIEEQDKGNKTLKEIEKHSKNETHQSQDENKGNRTIEFKEQSNVTKIPPSEEQARANQTHQFGNETKANRTRLSKEQHLWNKTKEFNKKNENRTIETTKQETANKTVRPTVFCIVNKTVKSKDQPDKGNKDIKPEKPKVTTEESKSIGKSGDNQASEGRANAKPESRNSRFSGWKILLIVVSLVVILTLTFWFIYAYRHPQSRSGMFLIEHRNPKMWFRNSSGSADGGSFHYQTNSQELRNL